jgi:hypothetical protein
MVRYVMISPIKKFDIEVCKVTRRRHGEIVVYDLVGMRPKVRKFQDLLEAKCSAMGVPANFSANRRAKYTTVVRGR